MYLVYCISGLAFFATGLSVALETGKSSQLELAENLWLLSAYAFLASLGIWLQAIFLIQKQIAPASEYVLLQIVRTLLLPTASMFLLGFGIKLILAAKPRYWWLRWVPFALFLLWLLAVVQSRSSLLAGGLVWLETIEVWARYMLYLPALALSGASALLIARDFSAMNLPHIATDCIWTAAAFWLKALVCGVIAIPFAGLDLWILFLRTLSTLAIMYFVLRIVRSFKFERQRELETATEQRLTAQQHTLEIERQAREVLERWNEQTEDMLSVISTAISQSLGLEELSNIVLTEALTLTGLDAGAVFLRDEQEGNLVLTAHRGLSQALIQEVTRMKIGEGLAGRVAESGEIIIVDDLSQDPRLTKMAAKEEGISSQASVPLKFKGKVLGVMNLVSKKPHRITDHEVTLLTIIGRLTGMAAENARLYSKVQSIAALEERAWLSRELHDGLAQEISCLKLKSKILEELVSTGQTSRVLMELHELQEVADRVFKDVRESILDLRVTLTPNKCFVEILSEYLRRFSEQSGIRVELAGETQANVQFAPETDVQLLRIIQEALTNIRKHSQVTLARITFKSEGDRSTITIEDDGRGFDPRHAGQDGQQHFGLQTMKERANSVGGSLRVSSQPNRGTRIVIELSHSQ